MQRYPLTAAARAKPIPVLPDVGSMMVSPAGYIKLRITHHYTFMPHPKRTLHSKKLRKTPIRKHGNERQICTHMSLWFFTFEQALLFGVFDHPQTDAVLDAAAGVEKLAFRH